MTRRVSYVCVAALGAALLCPLAVVGAQETKPQTAQPHATELGGTTHRVERGDFTLRMEREGRIDSAQRIKVRLIPEAFGGPFEVVEVAKRSGRVTRGETLIRFDGEALEKELDSARMNLDHARKRLVLAEEEDRILKEANAVRLEQMDKAKVKAATELGIWEKFDGPDMLKGAELSLKSREFGLADEKQELAQLEEMYKGTHLAAETKDIVLERARRGVTMSESWLELARHDDVITRETRWPQQDQQVRDAARWTAQDDAHARVNAAAAEQRKTMEIESARRAMRDAEERLAKLESDTALLVVAAPADGVMTRIDLEPKDQVNARQAICEVLNPSEFIVKLNATAEDWRVLEGIKEGDPIAVMLPEYPDVKVSTTLKEAAELGAAADQATHFPVVISLKSDNPLVRIGMRCKTLASRTVEDVLTVPEAAVKWEHGRAYCTLANGGDGARRDVIVGPSSGKKTVIVSGLKAGDEVIVEEAAK